MSQFLQTFPVPVRPYGRSTDAYVDAFVSYFQQYPKAYELAKDKNRTLHMVRMACAAKNLVCTVDKNIYGEKYILFTKKTRKVKTEQDFIALLKERGWKF